MWAEGKDEPIMTWQSLHTLEASTSVPYLNMQHIEQEQAWHSSLLSDLDSVIWWPTKEQVVHDTQSPHRTLTMNRRQSNKSSFLPRKSVQQKNSRECKFLHCVQRKSPCIWIGVVSPLLLMGEKTQCVIEGQTQACSSKMILLPATPSWTWTCWSSSCSWKTIKSMTGNASKRGMLFHIIAVNKPKDNNTVTWSHNEVYLM